MHKTIEQILLEIEREWDSLKNSVKSEDQEGEYFPDEGNF